MKPGRAILLRLVILIALAAVLLVTLGIDGSVRGAQPCTGVEVNVRDSVSSKVVTDEEVVRILMRKGFAEGTPTDSLDLFKIETILGEESCVSSSEAYTTPDGVLHIELAQRVPVVRFISPEGEFYADKDGYVIPLGERYVSRVPVIRGRLPFTVEKGTLGYLSSGEDNAMLRKYTSMIVEIGKDPYWSAGIADIVIEDGLGLVIYPLEGQERFIFGDPSDAAEKLGKMSKYLTAIVPYKGDKKYKSVDVRFSKQIICKK